MCFVLVATLWGCAAVWPLFTDGRHHALGVCVEYLPTRARRVTEYCVSCENGPVQSGVPLFSGCNSSSDASRGAPCVLDTGIDKHMS